MYCLRYFLIVLLFFPFPIAPPFLILLFLISMTLQHRPCAYCSLLLSAILMSTCSWNISSVDISPVDSNSEPPDSFLGSLLSFFKATDPDFNLAHNTTAAFQSITPNSDPPKSFSRCWCYSNFGRLFEPVSLTNNISPEPSEHLKQNQQQEQQQTISHQVLSSSPQQDDAKVQNSNSAVVDHKPPNQQTELTKNDLKSTREPQRQLKSLLSPLWNSLMKPQVTRSATVPELQVPAHSPALHQTHPTLSSSSPTHSNQKPTKASPVAKRYRSSFSRTPLVYSHLIHLVIGYVKSKVDLTVIERIWRIVRYNLQELIRFIPHLHVFHSLQNLHLRQSKLVRALSTLLDHYHNHTPFELRLNQLIGVRIFLGSRSSTPS